MKQRIGMMLTALMLLLCGVALTSVAVADTVTLRLNGSAAAQQAAQANEQLYWTIEAPGATAVRLLRSDGDTVETAACWEARDWNTAMIEQGWTYQEGSYEIWVQARYDAYPEGTDLWSDTEEANWAQGSQSGRIALTVSSVGQVPAPAAAWVGGNSASGDEWLKVGITEPLNMGEWYWADVGIPGEGEDVTWFDQLRFAEDNTLTFPAGRYDPGHYVLDVFAGALGYQNRSTRLAFTVAAPAQPMATALLLSKDQVQAGESLEIAAYAPGADRLRFVIRKAQNPAWLDVQEREGPFGCLERWRITEPGSYTVGLYARTGDEFCEAATATLTVSASQNGRLDRPDLSGMPSVLGQEEGLAGVIALDPRAEECGIRVEYCPEDGEWLEIFRTDRQADSGQTALELPAGLFGQNGRYKLSVWCSAPLYEGSDSAYFFLRQDTADAGAITLTVNGGTDNIASWPSSKDLTIRAQSAGATALRLLRDGSWDVQDCPDGTAEWQTGFGSGEYLLAVQRTTAEPIWREEGFDWGGFRWEDLAWTGLSNTVRVHVESPLGRLPEPTVQLSESAVRQGETVTVTVQAPTGDGLWYWLDVMRLNGNGDGTRLDWETLWHRNFNGDSALRLNTLLMEPGTYYLKVGADGEGVDSSERIVPLTVRAPDGALPEAALEFSRESLRTHESMNVTAIAPGCGHFRLEIRRDQDPYWRDERDDWTDRETFTWGWGSGDSGEYTFTLYYWLPGREDPGELTQTFTVTADGALDAPAIEGVPAVLSLGGGVEGCFSAVDGAEWVDVGIRYSGNGEDWEDLVNERRDASASEAGTLSFDGSVFSREGRYVLWVSACAVGKDDGNREAEITVIDPAALSDSLVLRVEGETDGSLVTAYLHQELAVTVEAPENVTAVRVRNSTSAWEYRFCAEEPCEWRLGVHQGGSNTFQVQASTDTAVADWWNAHHSLEGFDWSGLDWDMTGRPVTVQVIYFGDLDAPAMEFPNGTAVVRGDMLTYRISPVENAWGYGIQVRRVRPDGGEEGELLVDMQLEDLREPLLTALPTDGLAPGSYRLYVDPRLYGWHGDQKGYDFTVTAPAGWQEAPVFRASKTAYLTQEPMIFSAWAPGASAMRLCYGSQDNVWFEADGDTLVDRVVPNWERVYRVLAYACYDGDWVQIGELDISVTAPNGVMGAALAAPESVRRDEGWTMALTCDFGGTDGYAECTLQDADGNQCDYHFLEEREDNGAYTAVWQVDANALTPGLYYITGYVFPGARGYALGIAERVVTVSEGDPAGRLTVSKSEAEVFEDIEVTVSVPGATAVGIHDGGGWTCSAGDTLSDLWPMWDEGTHVFYGRYTTQTVDPEAPGFDWESVSWDGFTNAATVLVHPAAGTLTEPAFTVAETAVERGGEFVVTVTSRYEGLEDVSFGAHLIPLGEEGFGLPWSGADERGVIRVSTLNAAPGDYWLEVSANTIGWYGSATRVQVTVLPRTPAATVLRLPAGLTEIGAEAFAGIAAEKVVVPDGVTRIGDRAFADCPNLKEMELPAGVTFEGKPLDGSGPVFVYGPEGSWLQAYAEAVEGLYFIPIP